MKKMRLLIVTVVVLVVVGAFAPSMLKCLANTTEKKPLDRIETLKPVADDDEDKADNADVDTARVEVPEFVKQIVPGADWYVEEICTVNGKTYYSGVVFDAWTSVVYDNDGIILKSPLIPMTYEETEKKNQYRFTVIDRTVTVDFSRPSGVKQLASLDKLLPQFRRFYSDSVASFGRGVFYSLEADVPTGNNMQMRRIWTWLAGEVMKSAVTEIAEGMQPPKYVGAADIGQLYDTAAGFFFSVVRGEYGSNDEDYPLGEDCITSLRVRVCNGRYVTYQKYIYENDGRVHGFYAEELLSYDHVHQQDIDFDYLFKRGSEPAIRSLICKLYDRDELPELPRPGIGETGVVFSYQPYEIGSFADGAFHFTVPFKQLKPYLTERGHWCLGL